MSNQRMWKWLNNKVLLLFIPRQIDYSKNCPAVKSWLFGTSLISSFQIWNKLLLALALHNGAIILKKQKEPNQTEHEPKRARTKKSTNQKDHKPKIGRTKKSMNQKEHEPKTAQTQKGMNQKEHEQKTAQTKNSMNQKGH